MKASSLRFALVYILLRKLPLKMLTFIFVLFLALSSFGYGTLLMSKGGECVKSCNLRILKSQDLHSTAPEKIYLLYCSRKIMFSILRYYCIFFGVIARRRAIRLTRRSD